MVSISEYIKDSKGRKIGLVIAVKYTIPGFNCVRIGFSKCHKHDKFDKGIAHEIAMDRVVKQTGNIPPSVLPHVKKMIERAKKYFKDVPEENITSLKEVVTYSLYHSK